MPQLFFSMVVSSLFNPQGAQLQVLKGLCQYLCHLYTSACPLPDTSALAVLPLAIMQGWENEDRASRVGQGTHRGVSRRRGSKRRIKKDSRTERQIWTKDEVVISSTSFSLVIT